MHFVCCIEADEFAVFAQSRQNDATQQNPAASDPFATDVSQLGASAIKTSPHLVRV